MFLFIGRCSDFDHHFLNSKQAWTCYKNFTFITRAVRVIRRKANIENETLAHITFKVKAIAGTSQWTTGITGLKVLRKFAVAAIW
jgi:hypothetical protein